MLSQSLLVLVSLVGHTQAFAQTTRPFTVQDEIGLAVFGNPYTGVTPLLAAPDSSLVAVETERGLLRENRVEDEVRIYNLETLRRFANEPGAGEPEPLWTIRKSTYKQGPIISDLHWLPNSKELGFLLTTEDGRHQLWIGDVTQRRLTALTPVGQDVTSFDIRDSSHFAYTVRSVGLGAEIMKPGKIPAFPATGLSLYSPLMVSTDDPEISSMWTRSELWAANGAKPFAVRNSSTNSAIPLFSLERQSISLAPNGRSIALTLGVEDVPLEWETRFPPSPGWEARHLVAGHQDLDAASAGTYVSVYATVDLQTGSVNFLTGMPTAISAGWPAVGAPAWSEDSRSLLLAGTFLADQHGGAPCVAIATLSANTVECVQPIKPYPNELIRGVQFVVGQASHVSIEYSVGSQRKVRTMVRSDNKWRVEKDIVAGPTGNPDVDVFVKQSLNDPPVLTVTDRSTKKSRPVWDPNPQLKEFRLGNEVVYRWKDHSGRDWVGGLYKPPDYTPGQRYPLVIQTHGFFFDQFRPSGSFPTAFAARALVAQGIAVLQVADCSIRQTQDEGPCQVRGYEAAVKSLAADGLIDPDRVGIIGFSRTCFYVMQALTTSPLHFRAASITDGVNQGYLQYLLTIDASEGAYSRDADSIIGAPPYGPGLREWLERSAEFNTDKVSTPLQMVAKRGLNTIFMWEPYALLRAQKKPVDLMILNTTDHILTNPAVRLASQGGTVDWFRFWLQGYEDPDPSKAQQYRRWESLRSMNSGSHDQTGAAAR